MATLAYLLPPLTGLFAYLRGVDERARRHGLQSILLGALWPALLFVAASISPGVAQVVWALGALAWFAALVGTLLGRDPTVPLLEPLLERAAGAAPRER